MDQATPAQGIGRFTKYMVIGAVVSGLISSIPILRCINIFFCILNMAGIVLTLWLYLKAFPDDTLTFNESVAFGAISGAGAGLIRFFLGIFADMFFGKALAELNSGFFGAYMPAPFFAAYGATGSISIVRLFVAVAVFAAFGLSASFLGMQSFFKSRIRKV
ncbi:MAG: hypothetical protein LBC63_02795 [Holophagales bacterium]|jgi:hypothetical protein|nr:hypothetical protein [Holophagales bacterium]